MPTHPTLFTGSPGADLRQGILQGAVQPGAAACLAARAQADAHFAMKARLHRTPPARGPGRSRPSLFVAKEVLQNLGDGLARQVAIRDLVDLHRRGQRAAAQTGDLLHGEQLLGIRVLAVRDLQVPPELLQNQFGTLDVAGGAHADMDDVPAGGTVPELVIERGDPGDRGRRDLRQRADTLQGHVRQVAVVSLDRLKDLQHLLLAGADLRDGLINKCQVQLFHATLFRARGSASPRPGQYNRGSSRPGCRSGRPRTQGRPSTPRPTRICRALCTRARPARCA